MLIHSFIRSFKRSGHLYSASSRDVHVDNERLTDTGNEMVIILLYWQWSGTETCIETKAMTDTTIVFETGTQTGTDADSEFMI